MIMTGISIKPVPLPPQMSFRLFLATHGHDGVGTSDGCATHNLSGQDLERVTTDNPRCRSRKLEYQIGEPVFVHVIRVSGIGWRRASRPKSYRGRIHSCSVEAGARQDSHGNQSLVPRI